MTGAPKTTPRGFCLIVALALAPTFPALGQEIIILAPDSAAGNSPAVRKVGTVIGASLAKAGYHVFDPPRAPRAGTKIIYSVNPDIRPGLYVTRAVMRVEARLYAHPGGRHLGRIQKISISPFRIRENCTEACLETRLAAASTEIAGRVGQALTARLHQIPRPSPKAERPSRDW